MRIYKYSFRLFIFNLVVFNYRSNLKIKGKESINVKFADND